MPAGTHAPDREIHLTVNLHFFNIYTSKYIHTGTINASRSGHYVQDQVNDKYCRRINEATAVLPITTGS